MNPEPYDIQSSEAKEPFRYPTDTGLERDSFDGRRIWHLHDFEHHHVRPVLCIMDRMERSLLFTTLKRIEDTTAAVGLEFELFNTFKDHPWDMYAKAFASPSLVRVTIKDCILAPNDLERIVALIESAPNIQSLTFEGVDFPPMSANGEGVRLLTEYLERTTTIRKFVLKENGMAVEEHKDICRALAKNTSLLHLEIDPRTIGDDRNQHVLQILEGSPPLRHIKCWEVLTNHNAVLTLVKHPSLRFAVLLCLTSCYYAEVEVFMRLAARFSRIEEIVLRTPSNFRPNMRKVQENLDERKSVYETSSAAENPLPPLRIVHFTSSHSGWMLKTHE